MKPLFAIKAPRLAPDGSNAITEWRPAESHLTHDGQVEFHARMRERIARAAREAEAAASNVKCLPKRERK